MEDYLEQNFYEPLQLSNSGFKPKEKFQLQRLIPTELDTSFRHQLIQGYVHDPAAAMLGGISGNAGLFSNANDLAVIMQMLLNNGSYGEVNTLNLQLYMNLRNNNFLNCTIEEDYFLINRSRIKANKVRLVKVLL